MILRIDRLADRTSAAVEPDPAGAAVVQELLGGKFGEMSTFMNYTFQSFNFRARQQARPFFDLVSNIAAEEFGHIELVTATINTMLTGAGEKGDAARSERAARTRSSSSPAARRRWCRTPTASRGTATTSPRRATSSRTSTHNFFLETGARNNKLKVYEMVDHPAARALTGYLLVRGGVHQVAYARAVENLTGADLMKLFPSPRIPTDKIPECQPHIERGEHLKLYRFSPGDYLEIAAVFNGPHPETGEPLEVVDDAPEGVPPFDLPAQEGVFAPDYAPEEIAEIAAQAAARPPACPTSRPASWPTTTNGVMDKVKSAVG